MPEKLFYMLGRSMIGLYAGVIFNMDVVHNNQLPDGAKILSANHPSTTDPILMMTVTGDQTSILISDTLFKVPVLGRYLRGTGHIPVGNDNRLDSFKQAQNLLEQGRTIGIFPEGSISPVGGCVLQPQTGAARLALSTDAPIIPVGIGLEQKRIRRIETVVDGETAVGMWYIVGRYAMTVGRPLYFAGDVEDRAYVRQVSRLIMEQIAQLAAISSNRIATSPPPERGLVGEFLAVVGRLVT